MFRRILIANRGEVAARVAKTARRMGIRSKLARNASLALGTSETSLMELTAAYVPYANGGMRADPYLITKITSKSGKVLYRRGKQLRERAIARGVLGHMNAMLYHVVESGTGRVAGFNSHQAAGKTGTSQKSRDAWFVGHTAHLVTGIWMGNDNNTPMNKVTGGSIPAEAWKSYMEAAHRGLKPQMLPGDNFLLAALPSQLPRPAMRPRQSGEPVPVARLRPMTEREQETASIRQNGKRRSLIDVILGRN